MKIIIAVVHRSIEPYLYSPPFWSTTELKYHRPFVIEMVILKNRKIDEITVNWKLHYNHNCPIQSEKKTRERNTIFSFFFLKKNTPPLIDNILHEIVAFFVVGTNRFKSSLIIHCVLPLYIQYSVQSYILHTRGEGGVDPIAT